jgi:hypothetical protein
MSESVAKDIEEYSNLDDNSLSSALMNVAIERDLFIENSH